MSAPESAGDEPRPPAAVAGPDPAALAAAAADELIKLAGIANLADGVAHAAGGGFRTTLMAHELALNHRLVMRPGHAQAVAMPAICHVPCAGPPLSTCVSD